MKYFLLLTLLLFTIIDLNGQSDSSLLLPTLEINALHLRHASSDQKLIDKSDSTLIELKALSLADWIESEQIGYIKSYGLGGLATLSLRGMSANHSKVIWNGLPIESPMLGQLDLSLLPLSLMENAQIGLGTQTGAWGSGAIGGVAYLTNNDPFENNQIELNFHAGSFDRYTANGKINLKGEKMYSSTRLYFHNSINNYNWETEDGVTGRRPNAKVKSSAFIQSFGLNLNRHIVDVHYWYQTSAKQIPPTIRQNESEARQEDGSHRAIVNYKFISRKSVLHANVGWSKERILFEDPIILLETPSEFETRLLDLGMVHRLNGNWRLTWSTIFQDFQASIKNYAENAYQRRLSAFGKLGYLNDKFSFTLSGRAESIDDKLVPFIPTVSAKFDLSEQLSWSVKGGRLYRYPTLNDLYWEPGGNRDLQPEIGWSCESTMKFHIQNDRLSYEGDASVFFKDIENWIYWAPINSGSIWSASNLGEVHTGGVEVRQSLSLNHGKSRWSIIGHATLQSSKNQKALDQPKIERGQQLFYVPGYIFGTHFSYARNNLKLQYSHAWTDEVIGVNEVVHGYHIGRIRFLWSCHWKDNQSTSFTFFIENLWNEKYQVIEYHPMPGRHYKFEINHKFNL